MALTGLDLSQGEIGLEPEFRPFARRTGQAELAPESGGQALDNGQTQTRAAGAGAGLGLLERLEDPGLRLRRHPWAGILDAEAHAQGAVGWRRLGLGRRDQDAAGLGQLDRIAGQVEQDLTQTPVVGPKARQDAHGAPGDLDPRALRAGAQQFAHPLKQPLDVGIDRLQLQRTAVQLGQVQNVVDQPEQQFTRFPERAEIGLLGRIQLGRRQEAGHAQHSV